MQFGVTGVFRCGLQSRKQRGFNDKKKAAMLFKHRRFLRVILDYPLFCRLKYHFCVSAATDGSKMSGNIGAHSFRVIGVVLKI